MKHTMQLTFVWSIKKIYERFIPFLFISLYSVKFNIKHANAIDNDFHLRKIYLISSLDIILQRLAFNIACNWYWQKLSSIHRIYYSYHFSLFFKDWQSERHLTNIDNNNDQSTKSIICVNISIKHGRKMLVLNQIISIKYSYILSYFDSILQRLSFNILCYGQ